jgi:bifunctional DNase/RNase
LTKRFQIFPHGMMLAPTPYKPVMIFKTQDQKEVMPIVVDHLNAGLMINDQENPLMGHAHQTTLQIFQRLDVNIPTVYFNEVVGQDLMCLVGIKQGEKTMQLRFKAREVMSLAIRAGTHFYANEDVLEKSKLINLEWAMHQAPQFAQGDKTLMPGPEWTH